MGRKKQTVDATNSEVSAMLADMASATPKSSVKLEVPEGLKEELQGSESAAERQEIVADNLFDPSKPTQANTNVWSKIIHDLGNITVTDAEKTMYMKSVLNDVIPRLDVVMDSVGITITIKSLSNYEQDVLFRALSLDEADKIIIGIESYVSRLQYYAAAMQVEKFNQVPLKIVSIDKTKGLEENANFLRREASLLTADISPPRWQAIVVALRIFETKLNILNTALLNRDFWKPVSSDS